MGLQRVENVAVARVRWIHLPGYVWCYGTVIIMVVVGWVIGMCGTGAVMDILFCIVSNILS